MRIFKTILARLYLAPTAPLQTLDPVNHCTLEKFVENFATTAKKNIFARTFWKSLALISSLSTYHSHTLQMRVSNTYWKIGSWKNLFFSICILPWKKRYNPYNISPMEKGSHRESKTYIENPNSPLNLFPKRYFGPL